MKRNFSEIDALLPSLIDSSTKRTLDRINSMEDDIERTVQQIRRQNAAETGTMSTKSKILRNFIHHRFVPHNDESTGGYFLIMVEGHVLDKNMLKEKSKIGLSPASSTHMPSYGSFWEKLRLTVDKRHSTATSMLEWSLMDNMQLGMKADCFRFKLPISSKSEKPIPIKITFHRSGDIQQRYELSSPLRKIFPFMSIDPTENEIMTALWEYLRHHDLSDKKIIHCNEDLRLLCGTDSLTLSSLRGKIMEHAFPSRPIVIDYNLTLSDSSIASKCFESIRHCPSSYSRYNAKSFDIEVDIEDFDKFDRVYRLNMLAKQDNQLQDDLQVKYNRCMYIARSMRSRHDQLIDIQDNIQNIHKKRRHAESKGISSSQQLIESLAMPMSVLTQNDPIEALRSRGVVDYLAMCNVSSYEGSTISKRRQLMSVQAAKERHLATTSKVSHSMQSPSPADDLRAHLYMNLTSGTNDTVSESKEQDPIKETSARPSHSQSESSGSDRSYLWTAMHTLRGFMDVGDDNLFKGAWTKDVAKHILQLRQTQTNI